MVTLFKSEIAAVESDGCWLDSRWWNVPHRPVEGVFRLRPSVTLTQRGQMDMRRFGVFQLLMMMSMMRMDDSAAPPWTCFDWHQRRPAV